MQIENKTMQKIYFILESMIRYQLRKHFGKTKYSVIESSTIT